MGNAVVTETSSVFPDVVVGFNVSVQGNVSLWYCSQKLTEGGTNRVNVDKHERPSIFPSLPLFMRHSFHFCPLMTRQPKDTGMEKWHVAIRIFDSIPKVGNLHGRGLPNPCGTTFCRRVIPPSFFFFKPCRPIESSPLPIRRSNRYI